MHDRSSISNAYYINRSDLCKTLFQGILDLLQSAKLTKNEEGLKKCPFQGTGFNSGS